MLRLIFAMLSSLAYNFSRFPENEIAL